VDGAHSWRPLPNGEWQNLNTFNNWVLFVKPGEMASTKPITIYRDEAHQYRTELTSFDDWYLGAFDRDSWATLAVCLGYQRDASLLDNEMIHPWIWNRSPWLWNKTLSNTSSDTHSRP
jgi:hypothetical protein